MAGSLVVDRRISVGPVILPVPDVLVTVKEEVIAIGQPDRCVQFLVLTTLRRC